MDRREFLRKVTLWTTGAMIAPPVFHITPGLYAAGGEETELYVGKGKNYTRLVDQLLNEMGGIEKFVKSGDKVVIKPNIGWDRNVEQAANTHPDLVTALALLALDAGASKVSVFDRPCNEERRCYNNSGIKPAMDRIEDKRAECSYMDKRRFIPVKIDNGRALGEWTFYRDALEADCYINVPIAKDHGLSGLTIGMKNVMGVIGGRRGQIHSNIARNLADLNTVIRPCLTVVDATRILVRNGPQGGSLEDVKQLDTIIVSTDPVACDAYATTLFGMKPEEIGSTVQAHKSGLGSIDLSRCNIKTVS
ncbi:MAG: DUF362 domain-containing protein [Thermodesulfobacteriota bacterium]